jgi:hypothetical protein
MGYLCDRLCIDDEPMAKGGKRRFDPIKLGAIAGIEDTARFSFRDTEFFWRARPC